MWELIDSHHVLFACLFICLPILMQKELPAATPLIEAIRSRIAPLPPNVDLPWAELQRLWHEVRDMHARAVCAVRGSRL